MRRVGIGLLELLVEPDFRQGNGVIVNGKPRTATPVNADSDQQRGDGLASVRQVVQTALNDTSYPGRAWNMVKV